MATVELRPVLVVLAPSGQRSRVTLDHFPFRLGRSAESDVILRDNRASRNHAHILQESGQYVLEDLQSSHGTWVNGERVARHSLRNSDRIEFGQQDSYQITFLLETASPEPSAILNLADKFSPQTAAADANHLVKLRSVVEAARALQQSLSPHEVFTAIVDSALTVTGCERGFLLLREGAGLNTVVARDASNRNLAPDELRVPTSVIQRALESRRELLSMTFDPAEQAGLSPEMSVVQLELRSVVCLPLVHIQQGRNVEETRTASARDATAGVLYLDSRMGAADLSSASRELLQTLAIEASSILENMRLMEQEREKLRMEDELNIARSIQQNLLPPALPSSGWFHAAGSSSAATQVGGDYFDVRHIDDNRWVMVVADVSGKGVSAALLAGLIQGAFLMAPGEPGEIAPMLSRWNEFLLERTKGEKYATIFFATIDRMGHLSYANAGHCAPYVVSADGKVKRIKESGMPVGLVEGAAFETHTLDFRPGDKLVIYSDGLTEAEDAEGNFFETSRLKAFLKDHATVSAKELHRLLLNVVGRFTEGGVIRDDITVLVAEYRGNTA